MKRVRLLLLVLVLGGVGLGASQKSCSAAPSPVITTKSIPEAVANKSYSFQLQATGCPRTGCVWTVVGLPKGLSVNSKGLITGTPLVSGKFKLEVTVK